MYQEFWALLQNTAPSPWHAQLGVQATCILLQNYRLTTFITRTARLEQPLCDIHACIYVCMTRRQSLTTWDDTPTPCSIRGPNFHGSPNHEDFLRTETSGTAVISTCVESGKNKRSKEHLDRWFFVKVEDPDRRLDLGSFALSIQRVRDA